MGAGNTCSCSVAENQVVSTGGPPQPRMPNQYPAQSSSSALDLAPPNFGAWDFDVLILNDEEVEKVATRMLSSKRQDFSVEVSSKVGLFVHKVISGYLPNPYHNSRHALDVMYTVWRLGELLPWGRVYQESEQFAMMVAAFAHDIGHFGLTNAFLVDIHDELAVLYNDNSPLENMHSNKLFRILSTATTNVFSHFSSSEFKSIRKMVIDAILFTDPVQHGVIVKDLQGMYESCSPFLGMTTPTGLGKDMEEVFSIPSNKTTITRTLLHGADLSNPSKPWKITYVWAQAVVKEFFAQGDQEKALGIPVGMLNDRTKVNLPQSQLGFIQFMVSPFVASYTRILRNWSEVNSLLQSNIGDWARIYFEESGQDQSGRVETMRSGLQAALVLEIADQSDKTAEDTQQALPSEKELARIPVDCPAPWKPPTFDASDEKQHVAVREVRRWREEQAMEPESAPEISQHRELVLLYVLSDYDVLSNTNKDVIMKFNTNRQHFVNDTDDATTMSTQASEPPESGARVLTVAVAADNMRSKLDREGFDCLLSTFLDSQDVFKQAAG